MGAERAAAPVLTGSVPPLAPFYHARQESGFELADGLRPGETILLVSALLGTGGTGKTQLAVGFAHAMWSARAVDLVAWVPGGNRSAIVSGYARAAADLDLLAGEGAADGTADDAARRFLDWLRTTERRWAVILDDVASPVDLDELWPRGAAGQVIVTSRLRESELGWSGGPATAHAVAGFSRREALGYLNARLTAFPDQRIEALDLAEDLGGLPAALAQAAAVITETGSTCRDYRTQYAERLRTTAQALVEGCPPSLLATWSLAVEHAHELPPAGLSWPALVFASALDTGGIPAAVLTSPAACAYITGDSGVTGSPGDGNLVRSGYAALERLGLLSVDPRDPVRTVWLHAAVRAAVRAYLAPASVEQVAAAAGAALLEAWPEEGAAGSGPPLSQALRDSAAALRAFADDLLWKPEAHPVLLRAGTSLTESPAHADAAIGYWQALSAASGQLLGYGHAQSVLARDRLAEAFAASGRLAEGLLVFEATLADREAALGPQHQDTVTARLKVAASLDATGRQPEAIALYEQVLAARERSNGPGHRDTLAVRARLADAYKEAGRPGDSIRLYERALADAERELGQDAPDALVTRAGLADAYLAAGRHKEAIAGCERVLADRERLSGPDHPDTIAARGHLGYAYCNAGRLKDGVKVLRRALGDCERYLGPDDPMTGTVRDNLQAATE